MKKQSWIKENWFALLALILITIYFIIIILVTYLPTLSEGHLANLGFRSNSYICSKNPDKCVCEEYNLNEAGRSQDDSLEGLADNCYVIKIIPHPNNYPYKIICKDGCVKFRLKTHAELDIDDCNNNPREDEICKCEEYSKITNYTIEGEFYNVAPLANNWLASIKKYNENNMCNSNQTVDNQMSKDIVKIKCSKVGECIKSRPKTDWEKHPEDYVAETKQYCRVFGIVYGKEFQKDFEIIENLCKFSLMEIYNPITEPHKNDWQNGTIINQTTYRLKNECENSDWIEECDLPKGCYINQSFIGSCDGYTSSHIQCVKTICREKTDVEKLMDKDCDELNGLIILEENWIGVISPSGFDLKDIKQAWRQKGCQ